MAGEPSTAARESIDRAPLTFAQRRLWILEHLEAGGPAYTLRAAYRIAGLLDPGALARGLETVVRRHGALRTTFDEGDDEPVQVIHDAATVPLRVEEVASDGGASGEASLAAAVAREIRHTFDLRRGPLVRATLFRLDAEDHALVVVMHHIVSDGWSMGVFMGELLGCYDAYAAGGAPSLAGPPLQYADVARRQRAAPETEAWRRSLAYWTRRLAGAPPALDLPADRARPPRQTFRGGRRTAAVDAAGLRRLHALCRGERATLFMALLAGFVALVHRYTGEEDVVVGTPIANRNRKDVEGVMGFFVNVLPLRTDASGDPSFRQLLRRVRDAALDAYQHQDVPFELMVEALHPEPDLSRTPLFQVMVAFQNMPLPPLSRRGITLTPLDLDNGTSRFDLSLIHWEGEDGLRVLAEYNRDLFEAATVDAMLEHLRRVWRHAGADPDAPISKIPLASDAHRRRMAEWNATAVRLPVTGCLHHVFEDQVARTPDAVALVAGDRRVSFRDLNAEANRIAHRLLERRVGPGQYVGVHLPRSAEAVAAVIGVLKTGAAYLPLDPAYPADRLRAIAEDAGPTAVVTRDPAPALSLPSATAALCLDGDADLLALAPDGNPDRRGEPGDAAYLVYTSGSTGRPKGVPGTHLGMLNRCAWMWSRYPFAAGEIGCHKTSLNFVDSVWEVFGPLLRGIPIVVLPDETVGDPERLVTALARHGVTRIVLVPSLLRAVVDTGRPLRERLPDLRLWAVSGETLTAGLCRDFAAACPGRTLLNLYGSSEVSADVTAHEVGAPGPRDRVPIGRPIWNTEIWILDARGEPTPIGVPGEIHVGGAGVARGYHNRPEEEAERFVRRPSVTGHDGVLYRTGDRGRFLPDGAIEFLGRTDDQVKVRGHRVEPGDVEAALRRLPHVEEAAVVARDDGAAGCRLVAYVVARDGAPSPTVLRDALRAYLPGSMIPSAIVAIDAIPLTPNGKVDRRALPPPAAGEPPADPGGLPTTPAEIAIARVWREVLQLDRVSVFDNFYDLGGHSLLAVRVAQRLSREGPWRVDPRHLLVQSLGQLAARCDAEAAAAAKGPSFARRLLRAAGLSRPDVDAEPRRV